MPNAAGLATAARSNHYLRRALEQLPEYTQAVELRAAVVAAQRDLRNVEPVPNPASAAQLDDFLAAVARRAGDMAVFDAQRGALASLRGEVDNQINSLVAMQSAPVLASLAGDLADLMAEVRQAAGQLGGARNAAQAIAAGSEG